MALEPPPNIAKYAIPKGMFICLVLCVLKPNVQIASMKFISTHGALIKEYLTEDSEKMYQRITAWCKHPTNKKVRDVAFSALESFFAQVPFIVAVWKCC
jgi:hypothetical protein